MERLAYWAGQGREATRTFVISNLSTWTSARTRFTAALHAPLRLVASWKDGRYGEVAETDTRAAHTTYAQGTRSIIAFAIELN